MCPVPQTPPAEERTAPLCRRRERYAGVGSGHLNEVRWWVGHCETPPACWHLSEAELTYQSLQIACEHLFRVPQALEYLQIVLVTHLQLVITKTE